jgi:hypothetical protein
MGKHYAKMPDETEDRVRHIIKCFHRPLLEAKLRIDLLSVSSDRSGPPLSLHGYPCFAVIRVTGIKERTKGAGDIEIVFDEAAYLKMSEAEKDALVDHELQHAEIQFHKKTGKAKLDCKGRPIIKLRKHDHQFGWFEAVAERHGPNSQEVKQATRLYVFGKQTYFAFVKDFKAFEAPDDAPEAVKKEKKRYVAMLESGVKKADAPKPETPPADAKITQADLKAATAVPAAT